MMERLVVADRADEHRGNPVGRASARVELAKGLLHRPELLILDEPSVWIGPGARIDL